MNERQPARDDDQTTIRGAGERGNRVLDLTGVAQVDLNYLHPQCRCHGLNDTKLSDAGRCAGIPKYRRSRQAWHDLLEEFQPFPANPIFECHETGNVAARSRQAVYETSTDWVRDVREYDRHLVGHLQQWPHSGGARGEDGIGGERNQLGRVLADRVGAGSRPTGVDPYVLADVPARLC